VKARQQIETLAGDGQRRAFTPAVILFIALPEAEDKRPPGVTEIPLTLLPRLCPLCCNRSIIGHGRRFKQAHDAWHQQIWIRRGLCRQCRKTFTVLPDWSPPSGSYSLHCRQNAWERLRQPGSNWEQSVPDVADASRSPDPSTVRRWAVRLLQLGALLAAKLWLAAGWSTSTFPTILAWDWDSIRRILPIEARSP
jgi:hypothetical protein